MIATWSLRKRVGLAFATLGLILSLGFATVTSFIAEDYEHIVINELLDTAATEYLQPVNGRMPIQVYPQHAAPLAFRELPLGIHEPEIEGREGLHVGVYEHSDRVAVVVTDVGEIEELETYLSRIMTVVVLVGTALAGWLGWLLSALAIRPVNRLADRVTTLPVTPVVTHFEAEFARDALGAIARAIDAYQARLVASDESEKAFFADASHELRTPMTIIKGAIEVISDDPDVIAAQRPRLDRIDRAMGELGLMLDALLLGARRPSRYDEIDLVEISHSTILTVTALDASLPLRVRVIEQGGKNAHAPRRWVEALFEVLLLRLAIRDPASRWELRIRSNAFQFVQTNADAAHSGTSSRADLGISLRFAERLCRSIGWTLTVADEPDGLVVASEVSPRDPRSAPETLTS